MKETLTFDDVLLVPKFSSIVSRKDCFTFTSLGTRTFGLPIISSNMDSVTESSMANAMVEAGGLGALHRFCTIEENVQMYKKSNSNTFVSIGLGDKELSRAMALFQAGADNFIIDVANGASQSTVDQFIALTKIVSSDTHIMVGNFATADSIRQFVKKCPDVIPDSFKAGIGGGSLCSTRIVTGCGMPTLESVMDCVKTGYDIVADGGIRNSGDIAKCLAAGAKAVMVGSLLSGTDETPGHIVSNNGQFVDQVLAKKYRGSASRESYEAQGKTADHRAPEGESTLVPYKGSVVPILQELKAGLQSAMSYCNATTLEEFRENAEFIRVTSNGVSESKPHGKK